MTESMHGLRFEVRGPAAWIVLDRPERRNALSPELLVALSEALERALAEPSVRAVVLSGRGSSFCAGADLGKGRELAAAGGRQQENPFARLLHTLEEADKPVIAAVNGAAFGGGLGLVAAADIAIASEEAVMSFSEVRLGLIPAMISVVVLPKIGARQARRLFLTGRRFTATEALGYGLVHRVVPSDQLEAAVAEEVAEIAKGGPRAIAASKRLIREIPRLEPERAFLRASELFAERMASHEAREGMAAFTEKRKPSWQGGDG
jgi:methylglutaconyl-CoA hydratase